MSQNLRVGKKRSLVAIDVFSGSGAVTQGLKNAGFQVAAAIDFDPIACATYRENHPDVALIENDIRAIRSSKLKMALPRNRRVDLIVICAPCQPFSSQNRKKSPSDERNGLVGAAIKLVSALRPKVLLFENVPGLLKSSAFSDLTDSLRSAGYHVGLPQILNASSFGVPQRRQRAVLIASLSAKRVKKLKFGVIPYPTCTVRHAISGLMPLESGEAHKSDVLHKARKHQKIALERLTHIPPDGGSRDSLPERLKLACHKNDCDFSDVYGRMPWDRVAPTLTTGCTDVTRGRFAHPDQHRAITLREAARLQTFPDRYRFSGNESQIAAQIGNAVPVLMATRMAESIRVSIES